MINTLLKFFIGLVIKELQFVLFFDYLLDNQNSAT